MQFIGRMINKSKESKKAFEQDAWAAHGEKFMEEKVEKKTTEQQTEGPGLFTTLKSYLKAENFIISTESTWKNSFDTIVLVLIAYSCITTVFFVCLDVEMNIGMKNFDYVVTVFFALDFLFNFCQEYLDRETFLKVRSHKKIAIRYIKGMAILDFLATFPFQFLIKEAMATRLIRLTRLSKLMAILDIGRCKRVVKAYYDSSTRADRMQQQFIVMYSVKILRLIVIISMITYFLGCFWFLSMRIIQSNTPDLISKRMTFITYHNFDEMYDETAHALCKLEDCALKQEENTKLGLEKDKCSDQEWRNTHCPVAKFTQLVLVCYFALTTLSTVGYGDIYPISVPELVLGIIFMLVGIVFFSQMMGSFIEIIQNYNERMGSEEGGQDLNSWLQRLTRFTTGNRPLPKELIGQIDSHFSEFQQNNRLDTISRDNEFLCQCPRVV